MADRFRRILINYANSFRQRSVIAAYPFVHILAVKDPVPLIRLKEPCSDQGKSGFARPGFPHQTEDLTGPEPEICGMKRGC